MVKGEWGVLSQGVIGAEGMDAEGAGSGAEGCMRAGEAEREGAKKKKPKREGTVGGRG